MVEPSRGPSPKEEDRSPRRQRNQMGAVLLASQEYASSPYRGDGGIRLGEDRRVGMASEAEFEKMAQQPGAGLSPNG